MGLLQEWACYKHGPSLSRENEPSLSLSQIGNLVVAQLFSGKSSGDYGTNNTLPNAARLSM